MHPIDIALKYMDVFYSGENIELLRPLLADNLIFNGPFYSFNSAAEYIETLIKDPPRDMSYEIINSFEKSGLALFKFNQGGTPTAGFRGSVFKRFHHGIFF